MPRASGFFQTDPHPTPFFERAPAALSHNGKNRGSVPLRDGQAAAGRPYDRPAAAMRRGAQVQAAAPALLPSLPEASIRGRTYDPRFSMQTHLSADDRTQRSRAARGRGTDWPPAHSLSPRGAPASGRSLYIRACAPPRGPRR